MVRALCPPSPRRGALLIDPSYETDKDYARVLSTVIALRRKWAVGVLMVWFPLLSTGAHRALDDLPDAGASVHKVAFPPARDGHRMIGSALYIANPPYGLDAQLRWLDTKFADLAR